MENDTESDSEKTVSDYRVKPVTDTVYNVLPNQETRQQRIQSIFHDAVNELSRIDISDEDYADILKQLETDYTQIMQSLAYETPDGLFETHFNLYKEDMHNHLKRARQQEIQQERFYLVKRVINKLKMQAPTTASFEVREKLNKEINAFENIFLETVRNSQDMPEELFQEQLNDLISDAQRTIDEYKDVVRDQQERAQKTSRPHP